MLAKESGEVPGLRGSQTGWRFETFQIELTERRSRKRICFSGWFLRLAKPAGGAIALCSFSTSTKGGGKTDRFLVGGYGGRSWSVDLKGCS